MLSIEHVTKLLDDTTISAEEAERIRDACRAMVEIIYQKWELDRRHSPTNPRPTDKSLK